MNDTDGKGENTVSATHTVSWREVRRVATSWIKERRERGGKGEGIIAVLKEVRCQRPQVGITVYISVNHPRKQSREEGGERGNMYIPLQIDSPPSSPVLKRCW